MIARRRLLHAPLVGAVLVWAVALGLCPHIAEGAALPPRPAGSQAADPTGLETRLVTARLVELGLSPADASAHLAALSDEDRRLLAERLDEIGAGGSAAGVLAVAIIVGLLVILVLELMGRRVISRP
ncbi:MAG TPA: PA2779 family protein [Methylomirabilota bacterium]|nr:PA2779 family protein [Methylomirabilota bacterium]